MSRCTDGSILDTAAVTSWLVNNVEGVVPPLGFDRIPGGNSNITVRVTDAAGRRYVLRRPPISDVLSTAHDMGREHRIITGLAGSRVPVPSALAICEDPEVTGATFYVMDFIDGAVLSSSEDVELHLTPEGRVRVADDLVDVLLELHATSPTDVGLEGLGRPDGYIERQLRRWSRQLEQLDSPRRRRLEQVRDELEARRPPQGPPAIVHGDYRLGNCLVDAEGTIVSVLDWELCTIGEPLADLGYLLLDWDSAGAADPVNPGSPTLAEGFPDRSRALERYAAGTQRSVEHIDVFVAFSAWRRACILEGVYRRYLAGAVGAVPDDVETFVPRIGRFLRAAEEALQGAD